jgi:hypothetical protein
LAIGLIGTSVALVVSLALMLHRRAIRRAVRRETWHLRAVSNEAEGRTAADFCNIPLTASTSICSFGGGRHGRSNRFTMIFLAFSN